MQSRAVWLVLVVACAAAVAGADGPIRLRQFVQMLSPTHGCRMVSSSAEQTPAGTTVTLEWVCPPRDSTAALATDLVGPGGLVVASDSRGYQCRGACSDRIVRIAGLGVWP